MLQKLNERIQGVVAWVVIILIAITFTLFGLDYYMQSRHESSAQVEVNGQPITKQALELNYRRTRQLRDPSQMTAASENQLKQQILDEMIVNNVSMQSARASGFEVGVVQANSAILSIPQFQKDGHFSTDRYQQALNGALFTPESFQKEVRQGMLLNQQRFAFVGTSFALPSEIQQFVKLYMQTRDYDYLQTMSAGINHITKYGTKEGGVIGDVLSSDPFLTVSLKNENELSVIETQLVGDYNLPNVLCAVAVGKYFGVPANKIKVAIEAYSPTNSRSQLIKQDTNTIILDAYNANPTSMKAAIENFAQLDASKKVIFIGGMMELGTESIAEHQALVNLIDKYKWEQVVLVGGDFSKVQHHFVYFNAANEAGEWFKNQHFESTHLLIKGSRSMQMEKVLQ